MTIFSRPVHTYEHFGEEPQVIIPNFGGAESRSPRHDFLTGWVSRPRLGHMDPSSPIEKHFVLPPILYAGCQNIYILVSIASYYYAQERTRPAKEWLAKSVREPVRGCMRLSLRLYRSFSPALPHGVNQTTIRECASTAPSII